MTQTSQALIAFGPVPSRRLGRSLGINNIPPKSCSYSCLYCQVGITQRREIEPRSFYSPDAIARAVTQQVEKAEQAGESIDYLTFVPDGEPTLDINLDKSINLLRPLNIPIAVISNASLVWLDNVRRILREADWVSLKLDTIDERIWQQLNQPHPDLQLPDILQGIKKFADSYPGKLVTETMLVAGVNDAPDSLVELSEFLVSVKPAIAYLAVPTRPPAYHEVTAPDEQRLIQAFEIFKAKLDEVQYLIGYEGDEFVPLGDPKHNLLAITAVHPMREEAIQHFLTKAGCDWSLVETLLAEGEIRQVCFGEHRFYVRRPVP